MLRYWLAFAIIYLPCMPAQAGALPRLDFQKRQLMLSIGMSSQNVMLSSGDLFQTRKNPSYYLGVDYALEDMLSIGLMAMPDLSAEGSGWAPPHMTQVRATYRAGAVFGVRLGVTVSWGTIASMRSGGPVYRTWTNPALSWEAPMGGPESPLILRGLIGPLMLIEDPSPLVEAIYRPTASHELSAGLGMLDWAVFGPTLMLGWKGLFF